MAVKIRLRRMGYKKNPIYRIIVADSRSPRDGRFIEEIGTYDPNTDPSTFKVNEELAKKWLNNGAQPTEIVGKIFKAAGIEKSDSSVKQTVTQTSSSCGADCSRLMEVDYERFGGSDRKGTCGSSG